MEIPVRRRPRPRPPAAGMEHFVSPSGRARDDQRLVARVHPLAGDRDPVGLGEVRETELAHDAVRLELVHQLARKGHAVAARAARGIGLGAARLAPQKRCEVSCHGDRIRANSEDPCTPLEHPSGSLPTRRAGVHHFSAVEVSAPKSHVMIRTMLGREPLDTFNSGTLAGAGSFRCEECGFAVALHERDEVPGCPHCGGTEFRRSSIFGDLNVAPEPLGPNEVGPPGWLAEAREALDRDGLYLAFEDSSLRVVWLLEGWTRIGRSLSADVRFDDPTVSRRHAMLHREGDNVRILDDRSLNGVFVNGDRVDMRPLRDGDQVTIARFDLYFLICPGTGALDHRRARGAVA